MDTSLFFTGSGVCLSAHGASHLHVDVEHMCRVLVTVGQSLNGNCFVPFWVGFKGFNVLAARGDIVHAAVAGRRGSSWEKGSALWQEAATKLLLMLHVFERVYAKRLEKLCEEVETKLKQQVKQDDVKAQLAFDNEEKSAHSPSSSEFVPYCTYFVTPVLSQLNVQHAWLEQPFVDFQQVVRSSVYCASPLGCKELFGSRREATTNLGAFDFCSSQNSRLRLLVTQLAAAVARGAGRKSIPESDMPMLPNALRSRSVEALESSVDSDDDPPVLWAVRLRSPLPSHTTDKPAYLCIYLRTCSLGYRKGCLVVMCQSTKPSLLADGKARTDEKSAAVAPPGAFAMLSPFPAPSAANQLPMRPLNAMSAATSEVLVRHPRAYPLWQVLQDVADDGGCVLECAALDSTPEQSLELRIAWCSSLVSAIHCPRSNGNIPPIYTADNFERLTGCSGGPHGTAQNGSATDVVPHPPVAPRTNSGGPHGRSVRLAGQNDSGSAQNPKRPRGPGGSIRTGGRTGRLRTRLKHQDNDSTGRDTTADPKDGDADNREEKGNGSKTIPERAQSAGACRLDALRARFLRHLTPRPPSPKRKHRPRRSLSFDGSCSLSQENRVDAAPPPLVDAATLPARVKSEYIEAAYAGNVAQVRYLIGRYNIDVNSCVYSTPPLFFAVKNSHWPLAKYLLHAGADPNALSYQQDTALHMITGNDLPHAVQAIDLLVAARADVNGTDSHGTTVFLHAVRHEQEPSVIKRLVALKANPDTPNKAHETPLGAAVVSGQWSLALLLLEFDVDVRQTGCVEYPAYVVAQRLWQQERNWLLMSQGVDNPPSIQRQDLSSFAPARVLTRLVAHGAATESQETKCSLVAQFSTSNLVGRAVRAGLAVRGAKKYSRADIAAALVKVGVPAVLADIVLGYVSTVFRNIQRYKL